jgi:hypothetical protein
MSSPTYDVVRVEEVAGTTIRLVACRVPEPPYDDPVTKAFALMLVWDGSTGAPQVLPSRPGQPRPPAPPRGPLVDLVRSQDLLAGDPEIVDRFIASVTVLAKRNEDPDFYDRGYDHETYCAVYADEANLFQIDLRIEVTDPGLLAHLRVGMRFASTAYAPEMYRPA